MAAAAGYAQEPVERSGYALIVTNNRSLDVSRPDLQYADDDGAKYAELFAQLFGPDRVELLTAFDAQTARLHPAWTDRAQPPTREQLLATVERLGKVFEARKARGAKTHLVLIFAGHGDLEGGEGFLELQDRRLTARDLDEHVVAKLPADQVHLILDSCNSWFMLSPRKPGGRRWETAVAPSKGLLERYPHVGAVLSTSAEAVTFEWSELQSGIFSYEVRSALRGAADADGDGSVRYSELAAFLQVANAAIPNDLYRPHIFARGPAGDSRSVLLELRGGAVRTLKTGAQDTRRFTVRDALGVRVADVHKEAGTALTLTLPEQAEDLMITEVVAPEIGEARPTERFLRLPTGPQESSFEALPTTDAVAQRGDAPVFRALFAKPFGLRAWKEAEARSAQAPQAVPQGISLKDSERLGLHLAYAAEGEAAARKSSSIVLLSFGAGYVGVGLVGAVTTPTDMPVDFIASALIGLSFTASGFFTLVMRGEAEGLQYEFEAMDRSTEESRAKAVLAMEARFALKVSEAIRLRKVGALLGIVGGGALTAAELLMTVRGRGGSAVLFSDSAYAALGFALAVWSVYSLFFREEPVERAWRFYQQSTALSREEASPVKVSLSPTLGASPKGAPMVGLAGAF